MNEQKFQEGITELEQAFGSKYEDERAKVMRKYLDHIPDNLWSCTVRYSIQKYQKLPVVSELLEMYSVAKQFDQ